MRSSFALRSLAVVFLGAAGIWAGSALGGVRTHARHTATAAEFLPGFYQGYVDNSRLNEIVTMSMTLTAVQPRLLGGTLTVTGTTIPLRVAAAPGGSFVEVGTGPTGFFSFGKVFPFGDGSLLGKSRYLMFGRGMFETGSMRFLRSFPDSPNTPQLPKSLAGSFVRDDFQQGRVDIGLIQTGSSFSGTALFGDMSFPFLGTIGAVQPPDPDGQARAPVHAISVSPFATIDINAVYVPGDPAAPQPHMDGTVTAAFADGSVHTATFTLLPAVQVGGG